MNKKTISECQTLDQDAVDAYEEENQMSVDPSNFVDCNPYYGNAAAQEDLPGKLKATGSGDAGELTPEEQFKADAGFFKEKDETGKDVKYPLAQPIEYTGPDGKKVTVTELTGADLNLMGRAIFAEASGSQEIKDATVRQTERDAIGSVILNRIGASHLKGGKQGTVKGVLEAPNAFESVTSGKVGKYQGAADLSSWKKLNGKKDDKANLTDLRASMDTVHGLLATGSKYDYNFFLSKTQAEKNKITKGEVIGGSHLWKDETVKR